MMTKASLLVLFLCFFLTIGFPTQVVNHHDDDDDDDDDGDDDDDDDSTWFSFAQKAKSSNLVVSGSHLCNYQIHDNDDENFCDDDNDEHYS